MEGAIPLRRPGERRPAPPLRPALDALSRRLKRALGAGASVEGADVLVQGALVERVQARIARELGRDTVAGN